MGWLWIWVFYFRSSSDFAQIFVFPEVSLGHVRVKTPPGLELAPFGHLSSGDILGPGISAWDESCWNGMDNYRRMEVSVRFFFFRKKGEDIYTTCTCFSGVLVEMVPSNQMPSKIRVQIPLWRLKIALATASQIEETIREFLSHPFFHTLCWSAACLLYIYII